MMAVGYATHRGLTVPALVSDFAPLPGRCLERRDGVLVASADAVVVVWDDRDPTVRRVLQLVERKGIPVHIGAPAKQKAKRVRGPEEPERRRVLPD
jgi:hypothetical protein